MPRRDDVPDVDLAALVADATTDPLLVLRGGEIHFASAAFRERMAAPDASRVERLLEGVHAEDRPRAAEALAGRGSADTRVRLRVRAPQGWRRVELRVERRDARLLARAHDVEQGPASDGVVEGALERIAAHIDDALWLVDIPRNRLLYVSPGFERVWGRSSEELRHGPEAFFETIHEDDRERVRKTAYESVESGFEAEFRVQLPDEGTRWVRHRSVPVRAGNGAVVATAGITQDISERVSAEAAQRETQRRFEVLGSSAYEIITELDDRGRVVWASDSPENAVFRRHPGEPRARPDLVHDDDRERVVATLSEAFRRGQQERIEFRARNADGAWHWLETTCSPFETDAGEKHVLLMSRDISRRRELIDRIGASEERFRLLAENAHDLITEFAEDGSILYANPLAWGALGYTNEEARADHPLEYTHPDDRERLAEDLANAVKGQRAVSSIFRGRHRDGSYVWFDANLHAHRTQGGELRLVMIARDVTDRMNAEQRLRESEERYRQLVELSPEAIVVHQDGRVVYLNQAAAELGGVSSPCDLIGRPVLELVDPASLELVASQLEKTEKGEPQPAVEYRIRRVDGEMRDVIGSGSIVSYDGRAAIQGVLRDITEWKRAERERRRLELQLQEARKLESLGVLAGGIAHDFNNLLAVILGNARFALRQVGIATEVRGALTDALEAGQSASRLTRQLLAYAGRRAPEVRPIDLSAQVRSVGALLETAVPKRVRLELDLAPDLPAVRADLVQIEQVAMNLLFNAVEAIGESEGRVRIATGVFDASDGEVASWIGGVDLTAGRYVFLEVSDTGRGIEPDQQQRIFDPFVTTKQVGHGLGLSAVLGLVRGHGGGIGVASAPGRGTAIRVYLPCPPGEEAPVTPAEPGPRVEATVLVADDEAGVRRVVRRILEARGFEVLEAADGAEAVEVANRHDGAIDLAILDLDMPRVGGEAALARLRERRALLPVMLSSGCDAAQASERIANDPRTEFLAKPFHDAELVARIEALLESVR